MTYRPSLFTLCALLLLSACTATPDNKPQPPNIVFILIDDMGYGDLSITGNERVSTPNLDTLAFEGKLIEQFYVASPICSPSRVALFTGRYPSDFQIHSFIHTRQANQRRDMANFLPESTFTLADLARRAGYRTHHIGKWHMGGGRDIGEAPHPAAYGFDTSYVSFEGLGNRLLFADHQNRLSQQSAALGQGSIDWQPKHTTTQIYIDKAIEAMSQHNEKPFYLQLWLNDVHAPFMPSNTHLSAISKGGTNAQQAFDAVLKNTDAQLGRLFRHIKQSGKDANTLIIVTSDNGPASNPRYYQNGEQPPGSTAGLRGRKWSLYEGGIRMPLLVKWPAQVTAGVRDRTSVITALDLLPTLADVMNVNADDADGESRISVLTSQELQARSRTMMWEFGSTGDPAAHPRPANKRDLSPLLAIRDKNWKLLVNPDGSNVQLYNLSLDPFESKNLADDYPHITARLSKQVIAWRTRFRAAQ